MLQYQPQQQHRNQRHSSHSSNQQRIVVVWNIVVAGVFAAVCVYALFGISSTLPPPRSCNTNADTSFCENLAHQHLTHLSSSIGSRPVGSHANYHHTISYIQQHARHLQQVLASCQSSSSSSSPTTTTRIEIDTQTVDGVHHLSGMAMAYANITNVLVRFAIEQPQQQAHGNSQRTDEQLLVSSHIDSAIGSMGAGDDGVAVATMLETLRVLVARSCQAHQHHMELHHSIVFMFNNAEEMGLLGSDGFVHSQHPWLVGSPTSPTLPASSPIGRIGAFINLEGAGTRGKAMLFQTGPANAWIADLYARAVPRPKGTVLVCVVVRVVHRYLVADGHNSIGATHKAQDIFQANLIPSDTDFRVYIQMPSAHAHAHANASNTLLPVPGLDLALYENGYAYYACSSNSTSTRPWLLRHAQCVQLLLPHCTRCIGQRQCRHAAAFGRQRRGIGARVYEHPCLDTATFALYAPTWCVLRCAWLLDDLVRRAVCATPELLGACHCAATVEYVACARQHRARRILAACAGAVDRCVHGIGARNCQSTTDRGTQHGDELVRSAVACRAAVCRTAIVRVCAAARCRHTPQYFHQVVR
jgi:hypothetical protein